MSGKKKKNAFVSIAVSPFKLAYAIGYSTIKGTAIAAKGIASLSKKVAEKQIAKNASKPATKEPAEFSELIVKDEVQGNFSDFEHRLHNESLIVTIAGRRGSGKSALGFKIMENVNAKAKRPCYAVGVKQSVLPVWISSVEDINAVKNGGIVLVDEGAVSFSSRQSMSKENKELAKLLAIARHKDLTLLLITQNTGMIDKNVLNLTDTILLKEGSLLQEKMERSAMKEFYEKANLALQKINISERKSHVYVIDSNFEGLVSASLPSFWSTKVSKNKA